MRKKSPEDVFDSLPSEVLEEVFHALLLNAEKYRHSTPVIKMGGDMVADEARRREIIKQAIFLKVHNTNPIMVHGAGPQITAELKSQGIETEFDPITGDRICDKATLEASYSVMRGLNRTMLMEFNSVARELGFPVKAIAEHGNNGGLITADPVTQGLYTGKFNSLNKHLMDVFSGPGLVPILYPICEGPEGQPLNVNADKLSAGISIAMSEGEEKSNNRVILVTNVPGVLDKQGKIIREISSKEKVEALKADGTITGGMIPKVDSAVSIAETGVPCAVTSPDNWGLFRELFTTRGSGTLFDFGGPK